MDRTTASIIRQYFERGDASTLGYYLSQAFDHLVSAYCVSQKNFKWIHKVSIPVPASVDSVYRYLQDPSRVGCELFHGNGKDISVTIPICPPNTSNKGLAVLYRDCYEAYCKNLQSIMTKLNNVFVYQRGFVITHSNEMANYVDIFMKMIVDIVKTLDFTCYRIMLYAANKIQRAYRRYKRDCVVVCVKRQKIYA
jgi:hypothetical protein